MLKKTITYMDYNDAEQTEEFYFHLSHSDLAEMAFEHPDGLSGHLQEMVKSGDAKKIMQTFKNLISRAVGIRSADGRSFTKSDEISENFMQTAAYDELFMELVTDDKIALAFIKAILPATLVERAEKAQREPKEYTQEELIAMSAEEFSAVAGADPKNMTRDHLMVAMMRRNHDVVKPALQNYAESL